MMIERDRAWRICRTEIGMTSQTAGRPGTVRIPLLCPDCLMNNSEVTPGIADPHFVILRKSIRHDRSRSIGDFLRKLRRM